MNCIYLLKSKINDKVYIGKTNNFGRRIYEHIRTLQLGKHYNAYLQRHFNKYGKTFNLIFETSVIEENLSDEEVYQREIHYINIYKSTQKENGFNLTDGGEGRWIEENHVKRKETIRLRYGVPVYCYMLDGTFIKKYNCIVGCAEEMCLNKNAVSNAFNRGIRYKEYLFYKEPKSFDKYTPNKSRKDLYINVFNTQHEQIDRVYGLTECAIKYNLNVNSLNSRCRRGSIIDGIYFQKDYDQTMGK